eukprot:1580842-Prymnesium_polylepis.1
MQSTSNVEASQDATVRGYRAHRFVWRLVPRACGVATSQRQSPNPKANEAGRTTLQLYSGIKKPSHEETDQE